MAISVITKTAFGEKISFLFGTRFLTQLKNHYKIDEFEQLGKVLESPDISTLSQMLFLAHENACFFMRKDLMIDDVERMYFFIDEIGIEEASNFIMEGLKALIDVKGETKEGVKKKKV
jgi:hypothetical protein